MDHVSCDSREFAWSKLIRLVILATPRMTQKQCKLIGKGGGGGRISVYFSLRVTYS